ncbi:Ti-type conjugative transfer relaxase TraA [Candidatus Megaera polyxenophila]|nr:Ti-type conjugative transfer relaxase TraA [Candidatus Megaera polyxenophila]
MAHYSVHVSEVQRGKGQNAVASAAYNARDKLELTVVDRKTGVTTTLMFDYSAKQGLAYSKIYAPDGAPDWVYDREVLWNKAEDAESRRNSQTARKIMVALPNELNLEQQIALVEEIVEELVGMGMIVDANIHHDKEGNPHVHLMATTRELAENRYGEIGFKLTKNRDWSRRAFINWTRIRVAEITNEHLAQHGFESRVSHLSYKDLGIDLIPGVHEGPARSIKNAELSEINRQIALENAQKIEENPSIILDKLAVNKPVFTKEEIARELEKALSAAIDLSGLTGDDIEAFNSEHTQRYQLLLDKIMISPELALVTDKDLKDRELYTTTKRLELEERFISGVEELYNRHNHSLGLVDSDLNKLSFKEKVVEKVRDTAVAFTGELEERTGLKFKLIDKKPPLSEEQRRAVLNILNGSDISALQGIPGSGKTTAMREIVRQYEKAGFTVIGVTASSSAALVLEKETGIKCLNASLWRKSWLAANEREFELALRADYYKEEKYQRNKPALTDKHVMIVDEASMMELSNMDYFTSEALKAGAKIIHVGDNNQLSAVGYAGAFKKVIQVAGSDNLEESRRQMNPLHREATKLLSRYKIREALDIYKREGNIIIATDKLESRDRLIKDYVDEFLKRSAYLNKDNLVATGDSLICTYSNEEAAKLNREVRILLKEAGVIKVREHKLQVGGKYLELAPGEQIVFTRNFNRLGKSGIYNGEVGTIMKISEPDELGHAKIAITVNKANGKQEGIIIDTAKYRQGNLFDYGYAVTAHKLQGSSVDQLFVLHDSCVGYEAFNVMMTRHRLSVKLYANEKTLTDALYEGLDLDSQKARTRYELEEKEADLMHLGLVKISSKRINNSFAKDYVGIGESEEAGYLKGYIEANKRVVEIIQTISIWQQKELRQSGIKPEFWEHESWGKFNEERKIRDEYARNITGHYEKFADLITQTGMNYATILKQAENRESTKYRINNINTQLHVESTNYTDLVSGILEGDLELTQKSYNNLKLEIAENYGKIQEGCLELEELKEDEQDLRSAIDIEANYRKVLMPAYLSRIYREEPSELLARYQAIIEENGVEKAVSMIEAKPTILGKLKGIGIGGFSLSTARDMAELNIERLGKRLDAYNRSSEMEEKLSLELADKKFREKIGLLEQEIERLKLLLPSHLDERFLDKVGSFLADNENDILRKAVDFKILRESEEFEDVYIKGVQAEEESTTIEVADIAEDKSALEQVSKTREKLKQGQAENAVVTNTGKSSGEELSVSINIGENKTAVAKKTEVARGGELKNPETDINSTAGNNRRDKKQTATREARLDFEEVKRAINPNLIESIFRQYAGVLNPDGKMEKKGNQLFCGSLNINLRDGRWYRFSDGSKGDIFALVKEATGVDTKGAFEIIAGHAGIGYSTPVDAKEFKNSAVTELNKIKTEVLQRKDPWQVYNNVPENAPAFKPEKDLAYVLEKNKWRLSATYEYKNRSGELLGYVVRVLEEDGKKQTLPVSYCHNTKANIDGWRLKGFSDNGYKPIYGAEKLEQAPLQKVLIVEGEKAADVAAKIFPEYTVISWMGGSAAASKANWKELAGKEVTIWPDNDVAGEKAAIAILAEINKVNGFSGFAGRVDIKSLNLPEKWDLADKVPEHITLEAVKEAVDRSFAENSTITAAKAEAEQYTARGEEKIFWQQLSIGIKNNSLEIKRKSDLYLEIEGAIASKEVISYMDYATAKATDESVHRFLGFKDDLYREMLAGATVNYLEANSGNPRLIKLKKLFERDAEGNYLATPKEIVMEIQNIYSGSNTSYLSNNERYINDNKKLAEDNSEKAELHEILMKDFCILHQNQLGVGDLLSIHKERISQDLYEIISDYSVNRKNSRSIIKDSDRIKIAALAHDKINSAKWWEELTCDQIKLAKTSRIEMVTESEKRSEIIREHITAAMEQAGIENEAVFSRAEDHYLEYITANANNANNQELLGTLVARAVYEEKHIRRCTGSMGLFLIDDGKFDKVDSARTRLWQEVMGEKLVRAEAHIQEKHPKLAHGEVCAIAKDLIYHNYEREVAELIKDNPVVAELGKTRPLAAKYLAENLVDFRNNYGEDLLTDSRVKMMQEVSIAQAELHENIDHRMQEFDDKILSGKHKSLSSKILDANILTGDREMTAKSVTSQAGEVLSYRLMLREYSYHEQLHDHHEHRHDPKTDHDNYHALEHEYRHDITEQIRQTRSMQHEYHQEMEHEHKRQISINNDIGITY